MTILLLGPPRDNLISRLESLGDNVITTEERLNSESGILDNVDFLVSYGYRYILKKDLLSRFQDKVINLHIAYLPWNRGADPNLWSVLEDTPKGVTIHYIDEGIDTGTIIVRRPVAMRSDDTLKTMYVRLSREIEGIFLDMWPSIKLGQCEGAAQEHGGSYHRKRDRAKYASILTQGWNTPVNQIIGKAVEPLEETMTCPEKA